MAIVENNKSNKLAKGPSQMSNPPGSGPPGFDLMGYLHQHQGDIFVMLVLSTVVTLGHWRDWFYADDLRRPDGSPDPRAGRFNMRKALGEFFFVPTLVVCGMLLLGYRDNLVFAAAIVCVLAFLGSAFVFTTFEKARDGALGLVMQTIARYLGGGK